MVTSSGVRGFFFAEGEERASNGKVMFDKLVIEVTKAKERLEIFKLFRDRPLCDSRDFGGVHFNASF